MREVLIDTKAVKKGHYVPGVVSRGVLYVSGQLPMNHETGIMETGNIAAQTRMALHNVDLVLKAAGCWGGCSRPMTGHWPIGKS